MDLKQFLDLTGLENFLNNLRATFSPLSHTHSIGDLEDYSVDNSLDAESSNPISNQAVTIALEEKVPISRNINGKALTEDLNLSMSDIDPDGTTLSSAKEYTNQKFDELLGEGASSQTDTIGKLAGLYEEHGDMLSALDAAIGQKAPTDHASTDITYGKSSAENYGHAKLSDATDSVLDTSSGTAATPLAVKQAYDQATTALNTANAKVETITLEEGSGNGILLLTVDNMSTEVMVKGLQSAAFTSSAEYIAAITTEGKNLTYTRLDGTSETVDTQSNFISLTKTEYNDLLAAGEIKSDNYYFITDDVSTGNVEKFYVTFMANGWVANSDNTVWEQTVSVDNIVETDEPILCKSLLYNANAEEAKAYNKTYAILCNGIGETLNGQVKWKVFKLPIFDISICLVKAMS